MTNDIISAVFDHRSEAEAAIRELRAAGLDSDRLSIIGRDEDGTKMTDGTGATVDDGEIASDTAGGAFAGAGIGALLGVAALAIPGVGPLVAAGAIAGTAIPAAAVIGAGVGAAAGGLTGFLKDHGIDEDDATYYEGRINDGGIFVSADVSEATVDKQMVLDILSRNGGHNAAQPKMATTY